MSKSVTESKSKSKEQPAAPGSEALGQSPMMAHLLDALAAGTDSGEYGRLTFGGETLCAHTLY